MNETPHIAYRYAVAVYVLIAAYFWYFFDSLWLFLGKNYFPQGVSSVFSVQNSNFSLIGLGISCLLTLVVTLSLVLHKNLRLFVFDVGDELSRVAWPTLKETQKSTAIVIGLVIVASFILFFADLIFIRLINFVMGTAA